MRQLKRIVVGHDLDVGGEVALGSATALANRFGAAHQIGARGGTARRLSENFASAHFTLYPGRNRAENRGKTASSIGKP